MPRFNRDLTGSYDRGSWTIILLVQFCIISGRYDSEFSWFPVDRSIGGSILNKLKLNNNNMLS